MAEGPGSKLGAEVDRGMAATLLAELLTMVLWLLL